MGTGGEFAHCEYCGMQYSVERLREKIQEVQISGEVAARQTGTNSDIQQWKSVLQTYMAHFDYRSALPIVKKILEASPDDTEANLIYADLQELQYFDIHGSTLVKYNGTSQVIRVPDGVTIVDNEAFERWESGRITGWVKCRSIYFPDGLVELYSNPIADEMYIPDSVRRGTFIYPASCHAFKKLHLSSHFKTLEDYDIRACRDLQEIAATESYIDDLMSYIFSDEARATSYDFGCVRHSPWARPYVEENTRLTNIQAGRCQHCGGSFKGIFSLRCERCGKPKDY